MIGWVAGVKVKIKDHLSPAEAEIRAELGKNGRIFVFEPQLIENDSFHVIAALSTFCCQI